MQQDRVVDPTRIGHDGVVEPDVEPKHEPRPAQVTGNLRADAGIPVLDSNGNDVDLGFDHETIVELDGEALGDDATDRLRGSVDAPEEVDVTGPAERPPHPIHAA